MLQLFKHALSLGGRRASFWRNAFLMPVAALGANGLLMSDAQAQSLPWTWRAAATCLKAAVNGTGAVVNGVDADAWGLSCNAGPGGGQKVVIGNVYHAGSGSASWKWSGDGGAEGTSIAYNGSYPLIVGKDNKVWYRTSAGWFSYPNNTCEGGSISIRQTLGDNNLTVAGGHVYFIEANGVPSNSVRWWGGSCWVRLPTPPGTPKEIGSWPVMGSRHLPWIATTSNALVRWDGYNWVTLNFGTGLGIGYAAIIGANANSIWRLNSAGTSFTQDPEWGSKGAISLISTDGNWAIQPNGYTYHWQNWAF